MSNEVAKVLLVCGPPGVGKSTLGWEIAAQLRAAGVAHAVLDSDELDRVWPISHADQEALCRANLTAFWSNASARGIRHLVLVGVFLDYALNLGWILDAVPGAEVTRVVLDASDEELIRRVRGREHGSGADKQLRRTVAAAGLFRARRPVEDHILQTDGRDLVALAADVIELSGWTDRGAADGVAPHRREQVLVRAYQTGDHGACRALWAELTEAHRQLYADPTIGGEDPGAYFDEYLSTPERVGSWVAVSAGEVVGLTGLFDRGGSGEVEPVVVTGAHRDRGVGRALIEHVIGESRRRGHEYLAIRPVARNTAAIRAFHAAGFRTLGGHVDLTMDLGPRRHQWLAFAHLHGLDFNY